MCTKADLEKTLSELDARITELEGCLNIQDPRSLRCKTIGNRDYFYVRRPGSKEKYVPMAKSYRYKRLAQKKYAYKLLPALKRDRAVLGDLLSEYSWSSEAELADLLPAVLVDLCGAGFGSTSTIIKKWLAQTWTESPYAGEPPDHQTLSGHMVRSKSEELIANALLKHGQAFHYEKPLLLKSAGEAGIARRVYPDFSILRKRDLVEVYWEHFGRMDDPEYAEKAVRKIQAYIRAGFIPGKNLIITCETSRCPLTTLDVERIIAEYLE